MIVTKTKEELELEKELEEKRMAQLREDKMLEREFQLSKARIEISSQARWTGITRIIESIFTFPITLVRYTYITILALFKREIPNELKVVDNADKSSTIK